MTTIRMLGGLSPEVLVTVMCRTLIHGTIRILEGFQGLGYSNPEGPGFG